MKKIDEVVIKGLVLLDEIAADERSLEGKKERLEKHKSFLLARCKPACIDAIRKYNNTECFRIILESVIVAFHLEERTVSLHVHLRNVAGSEPDEDFDSYDLNKLVRKLKPFVDKELKKAKLPFKLRDVTVPVGYYPK